VVVLWDTETGKVTATLEGPGRKILALAFSKDGKMLNAADDGETTFFWLPPRARPLGAWVRTGQAVPVTRAAFSQDATLLVGIAANRDLRVWSFDGTARPAVIRGFDEKVQGLALSPDGRRLAALTGSGPVKVWDVRFPGDGLLPRGESAWTTEQATSPDGARV